MKHSESDITLNRTILEIDEVHIFETTTSW